IMMGENLWFKLTFAVVYLAVVWLCLEAVRIPELRDLIKQGYESTMRLSTMVVFILIGSTCFSVVFVCVSVGVWREHHLISLRGVAPREVKSSDIYWGAVPWIGLQLLMVAIVIAFPVSVTGLLDKPLDVDLSKVKIEVPQIELPPIDFGQGPPKQ